jgi:hypothetical protein
MTDDRKMISQQIEQIKQIKKCSMTNDVYRRKGKV